MLGESQKKERIPAISLSYLTAAKTLFKQLDFARVGYTTGSSLPFLMVAILKDQILKVKDSDARGILQRTKVMQRQINNSNGLITFQSFLSYLLRFGYNKQEMLDSLSETLKELLASFPKSIMRVQGRMPNLEKESILEVLGKSDHEFFRQLSSVSIDHTIELMDGSK